MLFARVVLIKREVFNRRRDIATNFARSWAYIRESSN